METNPYEYDRSVSWIPQQNQAYAGQHNGQANQRSPVRQGQAQLAGAPQLAGATQKPRLPKPMSKARTLGLAHTLKQWLVAASFVGFGTLSGLAAFHQVGTTATTSASSSTSQTKQTSTTSSQTTSTSSSSNSFLQQGGNNVGSSSSSQGSNSSSSTSSSSSSSQPVSGTRTS